MKVWSVTISSLLGVVFVGSLMANGCSPLNHASEDEIRATWIEARVEGDSVSIPLQEIDDTGLIHFRVTGRESNMTFMAYRFDGRVHVRAAICPPCRSEVFSLPGNVLLCGACGTRFEAAIGGGISGACANYPKANVPGHVSGGLIVMSTADLDVAYENTRSPGWP